MGKKWITAVLAAALSVAIASSAFAGTWENQEGRWKYHNDDGSYAAAQWVEDQGNWYYVEQDGFMKTGWYQDAAGVWYYLDENTGAMASNTTRNIGGTDYTFDGSGAWMQPQVRLNDGWNGTTYVNRLIGYQITLPDSYQAVSGNSVSLPENAQYDMVAAAPDGNSIIVTAVINMSELDGENWSDEELAYYFKYIYRSDSDVIGASFNDLGFAKITLVQSEDGVADVYFRRCGSYVLMIETVFIPSRWQEIDQILHKMKIPD